PGRAEQAAHDPPAGAVAPVREVVEAGTGDVVVERRDPESLGGRAGGGGARGAPAQARLERARHGHRRGAEEPGDEAVADGRRQLGQRFHDAISWNCASKLAPRRSMRWSPTRSRLAIAVR